jgi:Holliday junction DNA helicase RuvA
MIGKLTGIIDSLQNGNLILDVGGVGYVVFASGRTLSRIGNKGDNTSLFIETHVREDHIHLFGFADKVEQEWFNLLMKVQGVGAKAALSILSASSPNDLALAIAAQDKAVFTRADGVGPKLGTRIVTELKDKMGQIDLSGGAGISTAGKAASHIPENDNLEEALSALVNLGYGRTDAMIALRTADEGADLQSLIKHGLKELAA